MSDLELRTIERAATGGDSTAQIRLIRARVRAGMSLTEAQRGVYGFAKGDVYCWEHPETRTVHIYRIREYWRSACGTEVRQQSYYRHIGGGTSKLFYKTLNGWRPLAEVTCKRCAKSRHWLGHTVHPGPGRKRWGYTIPDWSVFDGP